MKSWIKVKFGEEVYFFCPKCKTQYEFPPGNTPDNANYNYCPKCSTKLYWKDTEEDLYTEEEDEEEL